MDSYGNGLPFELKINDQSFEYDNQEFNIKENQTIKIYFNSNDENARLYLEALDISETVQDIIQIDSEGKLYVLPSSNLWTLVEHDNQFYIDSFLIQIEADGRQFNGDLNIIPAQLSESEWNIMKEDLDNEIEGLSLDITRKHIGKESDLISSDLLRSYFIIRENYKKILGSLYEIKDKPHFQLKKLNNKTYINYDIPDNQLLKKIIRFYEKELNKSIQILENEKNPSIKFFVENAKKLRKASSLIKSQEWYEEVSEDPSKTISHSFALDSSYSNLYKVYRKLKKQNEKVLYNIYFPWKRSSLLYEIWCYLKICRGFQERCLSSTTFLDIIGNNGIPVLEDGTKMVFNFENYRLEVLYNPEISRNDPSYPLYTTSRHRKPDILINAYSNFKYLSSDELYLGSFVLDSKYRRFNSYWKRNAPAKRQIEHYQTHMKSDYLEYNFTNDNPIIRVYVLTPDQNVRNETYNTITHITMRPDRTIDLVIDQILEDVENLYQKYQSLEDRFFGR